jgi:hypothetical protein
MFRFRMAAWAGSLALAASTACTTAELDAIAVANGSASGATTSGSASTGAGAASGGPSTGSGAASGLAMDASYVGPKRGLAYGYNSIDDLTVLRMYGISWWQNWTDTPDNCLGGPGAYLQTGMEYVPMLWGAPWVNATVLSKNVPPSAKYLLTFQLPNYKLQSNLSPQAAAAQWPTIEAFAATRHLQIVSPAPDYCTGTSADCNQPDPHAWFDQFWNACAARGCQIDFIGVSSMTVCDTGSLFANLSYYEKKYHKPLVITQFTCGTSTDTAVIWQFMTDAVSMLENDPLVFRYAWFIGRSGNTCGSPPDAGSGPSDLLGPSGTLTPLGTLYAGLPGPP